MIRFLQLFIGVLLPTWCFCQSTAIEEYILRSNETAEKEVATKTFLKTEANKKTCVVGEAIIITTKYYTRIKTEARPVHYPSYNGFSIIDLNESETQHIEKINGITYMTYTLQKVQVYALQAGNITIEPMETDNIAWFIKEDYYTINSIPQEALNNFSKETFPANGMIEHLFSLKSQAIQITVNPLPVSNVPALFKGAVGNYTITSNIEKSNIPAKEKNNLTITIEGSGNMHLLTAPTINLPKGIELFEPTIQEKLNKLVVPIQGKKIFTYSCIAMDTGKLLIPSISFAFFNTAKNSYETIATKPILINATSSISSPSYSTIDTAKDENLLSRFFSNRITVISTIAICILCGLFFWVKKDKTKEQLIKEKQQQLNAQKLLEEEALLMQKRNPLELSQHYLVHQNSKDFYIQLNKEYRTFLCTYFGLQINNLSTKSITAKLDEVYASIGLHHLVLNTLSSLDKQLYMPDDNEVSMEAMYDDATKSIDELRNLN